MENKKAAFLVKELQRISIIEQYQYSFIIYVYTYPVHGIDFPSIHSVMIRNINYKLLVY